MAGVIVIIEVIAFHIKSGPLVLHWTTWYHWGSKTRWDQLVVQVWSVILIIIGALILALEFKRRRVTRLRLRTGEAATDAASAARGRAAAEALRQPITQTVGDRLDDLGLRHPPHVNVRVNSRSR